MLVKSVCSLPAEPAAVLGLAGVGKTTITVALLYDPNVRRRFGNRVYFASCEAAQSSAALLGEIARSLNMKLGLEPEVQVIRELGRTPTLLVLDNLETPWERDGDATEKLLGKLAGLDHLALLASLRGEELPRGVPWREPIKVDPLSKADARKAFLRIASKSFQNDPSLDLLLSAVDYLPLAITLLAYQAEGEPDLQYLWQRWKREKTKLLQRSGGGSREIDLETSVELSIQCPRMSDDARRLTALLGFLPEGIAREDVDALVPQVGEAAARILRKVGLTVRAESRLRMYAPIREYVRANYPPHEEDLHRAVDYFLSFLLRDEASQEGNGALNRFETEVGNSEAVVIEALARPDPAPGIEASLALTRLSFAAESCQIVLPRALEKAREIQDSRQVARVLSKMGDDSMARSQLEEALPKLEEARFLFRQADDAKSEAHCARNLGEISFRHKRDYDAARSLYEEALHLFRSAKDILGQAHCELGVGEIELDRSNFKAALPLCKKALTRFRSEKSEIGIAHCTKNLGIIALGQSDLRAAKKHFNSALALYRRVGEVMGEANCLVHLGDCAQAESDYESANFYFSEAIPLYKSLPPSDGEANCIRRFGEISLLQEKFQAAQVHLEKALELYNKAEAVFGRAHCFRLLGDVAAAQSLPEKAVGLYNQSLTLFESIPNPEFIGKLHEDLAQLSSQRKKLKHINAAREAWSHIGRDDLIAGLDRSLGPKNATVSRQRKAPRRRSPKT